VSQSGEGAIHDPPEVDVEESPTVVLRYFFKPAIKSKPGVIHPRINPTKSIDGLLGHPIHLRAVRHITFHGDGLTPRCIDPADYVTKCLQASGGEDQFCPSPCRGFGCRQTDS
jgi:hypothetical protein